MIRAGRGINHRSSLLVLASTCLLMVVTLAATLGRLPEDVADSELYRALAAGHVDRVPKPFGNRILMPLAARSLTTLGLVNLDHAFVFLSILALAITSLIVGALAVSEGIHPFWIIALLGTPHTMNVFASSFMPDLFHVALVAVMLFALAHRWLWRCMILVFLATLGREATVLAAVVLALLAWRRRLFGWAIGAISAVIVAGAVVAIYTRNSPGNGHSLPTFVYLALKIPYNGLKNGLGIEFWCNSFAGLEAWKSRNPIWMLSLPPWLRLGRAEQVGLMPWMPGLVLNNIAIMLTVFGVWPAVWLAGRKIPPTGAPSHSTAGDLWLRWCVVYGVLSFLLGPFLGASVERLVGYGWPAFWIAAPILFHRLGPSRRQWLLVTLASLAVAWLPSGVAKLNLAGNLRQLVVLLLAGTGWVLAHGIIKRAVGAKAPLNTMAEGLPVRPNVG